MHPLPPAGSSVGVAISGGADSTALLLQLHDRAQWRLAAIHVNHGWRGAASDADAEFCRELAARLEIPFHLLAPAPGLPAASGNAEEAAREQRLQFFNELIETKQVDYVLTAHTRNDQAETVLFRILRGASLQGLSGIQPRLGRILRPLLDVPRSELIFYLQSRGQTWREDASNADLHFRRNRIRQELLPQLERDWNPELTRALAQTAQLARDEQDYWASLISPLAAQEFRLQGNSLIARASTLVSQPKAVARRLIRWAIERVKGDLRQIEHQHVEAVLELCSASAEGHGRIILPSVDIMRSFEWIRLALYEPGRDRAAERNLEMVTAIPGEAQAPDGSRIRVEFAPPGQSPPQGNENDTVESSEIACEAVVRSQAVVVRSWRPGDRYCPAGRSNVEKLKSMFQEYRVPLWDRGTWPIITVDSEDKPIIWARKFGPVACQEAVRPERVLRITRFE